MTITQKNVKLASPANAREVEVSPDAAFIHEQAEYLEAFNHDTSARREHKAEWSVLDSWFSSNGADFEGAELDGDTAEIARLAADLRGKLDALGEVEEEQGDDDGERAEYYADLSAGMRGW